MSGPSEHIEARLRRVLASPVRQATFRDARVEPALVAHFSPALERLTGGGKTGCTAFAAFARLTEANRLSPDHAHGLANDRDAVLNWYVAAYGSRHLPSRVPLSAADIAYLLSDEPLRGLGFRAPRLAVWQALMPFSGAPLPTDAVDETAIDRFAYWWSCRGAPDLGVADCLVPDYFVQRLLRRRPEGGTVFEILVGEDEPGLRQGSADEAVADLSAVLLAIERGGLFPFVVSRCRRFMSGDADAAIPPAMADKAALSQLRGRLSAAAEAEGFDLEAGRYRTIDVAGNRGWIEAREHAPAAPAIATFAADVEVVGPFSRRSGLGQATRLSVETLRRAGVKVAVRDFTFGFPSAPEDGIAPPSDGGRAGVSLIHLNPDMLPLAFARGAVAATGKRVGYFFWELDRPASCDFLALDLVDAIWTASDFVRGIYRPYFDGLVETVGLAVPELDSGEVARADGFTFLSVFDGFSYAERKNPLGAIRAFQAAFPGQGDVRLVLKTHNRPVHRAGAQAAIWAAIDAARASDPRIRVIEDALPPGAVRQLIAGADAFLSLHRSEGFGLGPAEAMALGVPVVVTAYGGTEDFCDDATAFRVACTMTPVGPDGYAHAEPGHRWADPDPADAVRVLREARSNAALRAARAAAGKARLAEGFSFAAVSRRYVAALERVLGTQ